MKRIAVLMLFVTFVLLPTSAVYAASPHQVTIPDDLRAALVVALTGFVSYFITQGIKSLSTMLAQIPWLSWVDISGWGSVITAFLVTGAMFFFDMGLGYVPAAFGPFAPLFVQILIAALIAMGSHSTVKRLSGAYIR